MEFCVTDHSPAVHLLHSDRRVRGLNRAMFRLAMNDLLPVLPPPCYGFQQRLLARKRRVDDHVGLVQQKHRRHADRAIQHLGLRYLGHLVGLVLALRRVNYGPPLIAQQQLNELSFEGAVSAWLLGLVKVDRFVLIRNDDRELVARFERSGPFFTRSLNRQNQWLSLADRDLDDPGLDVLHRSGDDPILRQQDQPLTVHPRSGTSNSRLEQVRAHPDCE